MLNAPDESETQLTALDLAVRSPVNLNITRCLLACGATPTARVVLKLVRNGAGCGRLAATRDCFLGAMAASEWATNPLIPGVNISVALMEAKRQVRATEALVGLSLVIAMRPDLSHSSINGCLLNLLKAGL